MSVRILIVALMLMFVPVGSSAQSWGFDIATVEALIQDHKDVRAKMMIRVVIEEGNKLLHDSVNSKVKDYKKVCDLLDKYDKYFDMLDLVLRSATTVLKLHKNYTVIKDRLGQSRRLLEQFNENCLKTGKLEYSDKIIIEIGNDMVQAVVDDIEGLSKSLTNLLLYQGAGGATGLMAMSTKNLIEILDNINTCFDHITLVVNRAYIKLRGYIIARLGPFFRRTLYRSRPVSVMATDALTRWLEVTHRAANN